jgi:hypothetical protein
LCGRRLPESHACQKTATGMSLPGHSAMVRRVRRNAGTGCEAPGRVWRPAADLKVCPTMEPVFQ